MTQSSEPAVRTRPLFRLRETVPPLLVLGQTPDTYRRVGVVTGGAFEGERLSGEVVDGGNDWQSIRSDGCTKLEVRLILRTADDALLLLTYHVLRHGPPEVMAALDRGEVVDPSTYYFRLSGLIETADPRYDWLNRIIVVGVGDRHPDGPVYDLFEIL